MQDTTNGNGSSNGSNSNGHCHENGTRFTCFTVALRVSSSTKVPILTRTTPQDQAATPTKTARADYVTAAVTRVAVSIAMPSPPMRFVTLTHIHTHIHTPSLSHTRTHSLTVCVCPVFYASRSHFDVIHDSYMTRIVRDRTTVFLTRAVTKIFQMSSRGQLVHPHSYTRTRYSHTYYYTLSFSLLLFHSGKCKHIIAAIF